ncbi:MAG: RNA 2',3'-cyclic phosphodiesterase [Spirochaetia bacterium]|nr:RNA 2',3'-cyclic phosphodiesterase [Spirochaetia bacterium]
MRVFIAIPVPAEAASALREAAAPVSAKLPLRLLPAVNLHLTLIFLGEQNKTQVEQLAQFMKKVSVSAALRKAIPPLIGLDRFAVYPRGSAPPRVLAAEAAAGREQLGLLHRILIEGIPASFSGKQSSGQLFRPHITLARWTRKAGFGIESSPVLVRHSVGISFKPRHLVLYRSQLSREGASYDPLFAVELIP